MLVGKVDAGEAILHEYMKATVGFAMAGSENGSSPKGLTRVFALSGNPWLAHSSLSPACIE